jgi:hypothetical protein
MSTLFYGQMRDGLPGDENVIRSTTAVVEHDIPPAEATRSPEMSDVQTDSNPKLGLETRSLASEWHEGEQYTPEWLGRASDQQGTERINRQIASSGTAAKREEAGQFGHGTMSYAVGIAPVADLVDGGRLGNDYFVTTPKDIQEGVTGKMEPSNDIASGDKRGALMGQGKEAARAAAESGLYNTWYSSMQGK